MPEITFVPYLEGEPYDASSLNTRFQDVQTGLEGVTTDGVAPGGLNSGQVPSLAGYTEATTSPQTPHLITIEGTSYDYFDHASNIHIPTVNLAEDPPRWPVGGGGGGNAYRSNLGSWLTINIGSASTPCEVYFATNTPAPIPLHLRRLNAITAGETWAQGLVVLLNVHLHKLVRDAEDAPNSRLYAGFCIQVFVGDTLATAEWYIVQRSIRFVSEKVLPTYLINDPTGEGVPQVAPDAREESWIDVPIRTVIRKQDLIDFGFADDNTMPPILGVRACIGKYELFPGPVQPGSYGGGAPTGAPTTDTDVDLYVRQGNMTMFPLHAAAGVEQFVK